MISGDELISNYIKNNHFGNWLGMHFKIVKPGLVSYHLKIGENHLATPRAGHGGVISALMDAAMGVAGLSAVADEGKVVATMEFKINFLNPFYLNDELVAEARVEKKGKRILVIGGEIFAKNRNEKIAMAFGTFNSYPAEKAGY